MAATNNKPIVRETINPSLVEGLKHSSHLTHHSDPTKTSNRCLNWKKSSSEHFWVSATIFNIINGGDWKRASGTSHEWIDRAFHLRSRWQLNNLRNPP